MSEEPKKEDIQVPEQDRKIERGLWYQRDPIDSFTAHSSIQEIELIIARYRVDPILGCKPLDKYFAIYIDFYTLQTDDILITVTYYNKFEKKVKELTINFDSITNMEVCFRE